MSAKSKGKKQVAMFTDQQIGNLKPRATKYREREANGFGIRVMPTGSKTWIYTYDLDGKRHEMTLGTYPVMSLAEARAKHAEEYISVTKKRDPLEMASAEAERIREEAQQEAERIREEAEAKVKELETEADSLKRKIQMLHDAPTVKTLYKEYIKHAEVVKRSWREDQRVLNKDVLPTLGDIRLAEVTRGDIKKLVKDIELRGAPAAAALTLKITKRMFSWGIEQDITNENPCVSVKARKDGERTRALNDAEIATLWKALDGDSLMMGDDIKRIMKLILLTAARPGEVSSMHAANIDPDMKWWTIPASVHKSNREQRVYLSPLARQIIGDIKGKGYVFPCPHVAKKTHIDSHAIATAIRRNLYFPMTDPTGAPLFTKDGKQATVNNLGIAPPFGAHDLRRTANTIMAEEKVLFEHRERVLGHTLGKLDRIYNKFDFADEKQDALERIERHVLKAITPQADNVVSITSGKGIRKAA